MDELDREVMIALLQPQSSRYKLWKNMLDRKFPYKTMSERIRKLQEDKLLEVERAKKKNGKLDNRKTQRLTLTDRGLATLILKENVDDKELRLASQRIFLRMSRRLQSLMDNSGLSGESILRSVFDRMKPKINLDCFNQEYFEDTFLISMAEYLHETHKKASVDRIEKIKRQTIPKVSNETINLMNEILETLEKEQRKFTRLASDIRTAIENIEKSKVPDC
jgi:hypothetical protein